VEQYTIENLQNIISGNRSIVPSKICKDLHKAINSESYSDFTIVCNDHKFHTHKIILYSRADFFRALLDSGMQEAQKNTINFSHFPLGVILPILEYLYTDGISNLEPDNAIEIIEAANRLNLPRLSMLCETAIIKGVDTESVCFVYHTAKLYNAQKLVQFCQSIIISEFAKVSKTESFTQLPPEEVMLLTKLERDSIFRKQ